MSAHKIIEGLKQAASGQVARQTIYSGCGTCKGTGWKHKWNEGADLVPVDPPELCPHCKGMQVVRISGKSKHA